MTRIKSVVSAFVLLVPLAGHAEAADVQPATTQPGPPSFISRRGRLRDRFAAANAAHDGHLTLAEARAGAMRGIVRNFDRLDAAHKGYVTLGDIQRFRQARRAARQPGLPPVSSGR